jgi:chemotaxis protein MotB
MRSAILAVVGLLAVGCGVPKSQYDAAIADAQRAKATGDETVAAKQKEIEDLNAKLADAEGKAGAADEATRSELEELRRQKAAAEGRLKLFEDFLAKFKKMIEAGKLDITVRRGQIVLALGTDILFDTGKTEIKPEGKAALAEVADVLKGVTGRRFQVSGHTDNVPMKAKEFASNWELSTARALAVIKLLLEKGVRAEALSAAGYAEFDPAQNNNTDKGRAKNRRIEIVIVPNIEDLVKMPELGGKVKETPAEASPPAAGKPKEPPKPPSQPPPTPPKPKEPPPTPPVKPKR